jgi:hypothetical protein
VSWDTIVPKRIVDLEAVSRDNQILLQWTAPKENTDKSERDLLFYGDKSV